MRSRFQSNPKAKNPMIYDFPFKNIGINEIQNLVADKVRESANLDYKEHLACSSDQEKKEFLADISAFANTAGGILIFGIKEERDATNKPTGVPLAALGLANLNIDQEILRITAIIQNGLDPRVSGVEIRAIDGFDRGSVLILRVPKSLTSPHMVTLGGTSKFYARNSAGKYQLHAREIASLVLQTSQLPEKIRSFHQDRISKMIAGETPVRLRDRVTHTIHVVPVNVFAGMTDADISNVHTRLSEIKPPGAIRYEGRYNLNGYVSFAISDECLPISYVQLFRNGVIEIATARADWVLPDGRSYIPSSGYERYLIEDTKIAIGFLSKSEINPPVVIIPSIIGVKDSVFITHMNEHGLQKMYTFDEANLILPDVTVREYGEDLGRALRPAFDYLWQCGGFPRSGNYSADGYWVGQELL